MNAVSKNWPPAKNLWVLGRRRAGLNGGALHNRRVGTLAMATAHHFLFQPNRWGAYGDGGRGFHMMMPELAETLRSILFHAKGAKRSMTMCALVTAGSTNHASLRSCSRSSRSLTTRSKQRTGSRPLHITAERPMLATPKVPDGLQSVWAKYTVPNCRRFGSWAIQQA